MKVWGEAYGEASSSVLTTSLFHTPAIVEQQSHFSSEAIAPHYFNGHGPTFQSSGIRDRLPSAKEKPLFYVGIYALIGLSTVIVSVCSAITQYTGALRASRSLFKRLLDSVVRATMRWQDVTPAGRMLNRFSKVNILGLAMGL